MSKFTLEMNRYFSATVGAYSLVTDREATGDKSVTLDRYEKEVIFSAYHPDSFERRGGAESTGYDSHKEFIFHDRNHIRSKIKLAIVYPKKTGQELRLYFSKPTGFDPQAGEYWYIFRDGDDVPHIGVMDSFVWENIFQSKSYDPFLFKSQQNFDDEDDSYQKEVGAAIAGLPISTSNLKYRRSSTVAKNALKAANYLCEAEPSHVTFSTAAGLNYQECHHLIPVSLQNHFEAGLDVEENIAVLCATCHRFLHYGRGEEKFELLTKLWLAKKDGLDRRQIKISFKELLSIYTGNGLL
ncbi:HNH endonuclease [Peribacillus sp. NPDC101481]|uniref:HNH endonuclease n=1 Tax=Peribacillus sp. NPDC101481 TaxID=3364403 RepID=UPI0037F6588D